MIYLIPMILVLIFLAWFFSDEFKDNTYEFLAMVCIGSIVWPITIVWMVRLYLEWRAE